MQAQQLLTVLASGEAVSGEWLAERAGVTRAAIWKQIEALRSRGVPIEARGTGTPARMRLRSNICNGHGRR